jgi:ABC-type multidrug transport system ATPase subunit
VNLQFNRGRLTILMGSSGSGKTTVLTLLSCLRDVQAGRAQLLGSELAGTSQQQRDRSRCKCSGAQPARESHCHVLELAERIVTREEGRVVLDTGMI